MDRERATGFAKILAIQNRRMRAAINRGIFLWAWGTTGSGAAKSAHHYLLKRSRSRTLQCLHDSRCAALKRLPMVGGKNNDREVSSGNVDVKAKTPVRRYDRLETGPFGRIDEKPVYQG